MLAFVVHFVLGGGRGRCQVPPAGGEQEEEDEEEKEDENDDDGCEDDEGDAATVVEIDQNERDGGGGSDVAILDVSGDDDNDDEDTAEPEIKGIVDRYEGDFLHRRLWRPLKPFRCPGDGYRRGEHLIVEFRSSTDADLKVARPALAPLYDPTRSSIAPKSKYDNQRFLYNQCKKVAVSSTGEVFRATDEEIESVLKETERKEVLRGMKGGTYVKVVREARRRHRLSWEADAERKRAEREEEEEEESDVEAARQVQRQRVDIR